MYARDQAAIATPVRPILIEGDERLLGRITILTYPPTTGGGIFAARDAAGLRAGRLCDIVPCHRVLVANVQGHYPASAEDATVYWLLAGEQRNQEDHA